MAIIEHVNIEDPFIHEPKGISTANVGETYIADGAGSGDWTPAETYGAFNGVNTRGSSYTLVLGDKGFLIDMNLSTDGTLTVPKNSSVAFPINTVIFGMQRGANGKVTITPVDGDVTINSLDNALQTVGPGSFFMLWKQATDTWYATGNLA